MNGPFASAVCAAVDSDRGDAWAEYLPQVARLGHVQHVRYTERPDAWDIRAFNQLSRVGRCHRARLSHAQREDGSMRPMVIVLFGEWDGEERRIGVRLGAEFRRETLQNQETVNQNSLNQETVNQNSLQISESVNQEVRA